MGEAKRRKALAEGLEQIRQEGQGVWQMTVYGLEGVAELAVNALAGDDYARRVLLSLEGMVRNIEALAATPKPMLCLLCENVLAPGYATMPAAWVILHARRDVPYGAVGNGVCHACWARWPSPQALSEPVTDYYRRKLITDLRVLPPIGQPGNA